ncbi:aromatic prenyltransferase [Xylona heveae TC161]|uniref:Aromatic prenyltransferase n=1 Tax=Xylona heveae (strain CBS 132557 / TC161) TaxID=1328760 RepID=A0A165IQ93_XYLHT|nr:aromatic prenyltransferase [Xylona heveae TC161]KZF25225.1 aromatic prenyltransferase [Xylona heveae TC161]
MAPSMTANYPYSQISEFSKTIATSSDLDPNFGGGVSFKPSSCGGITTARKPWQILQDALGFRNEDEHFWWETTASVLGCLLEKAGYDVHLQYQYLSLYYRYVLPSYGPRPLQPGVPHWKSFMCDDFSPFEPSWNWDGSKSIIRFSFEPINRASGTSADPFNQIKPREVLAEISDISAGLDTQWYDHFAREFFLPSETASIIRSRLPEGEHMSQSFLAWDLNGGEASTKAYFFPILRSLETGRSTRDIVVDAITKLDSEKTSLRPSLTVLEDYMSSLPTEWQAKYEMIAIDCTDPSKSRIKIYVRMPSMAFNKVRDMYCLGGRLHGPNVDAAMKILDDLWPRVLYIPEGTGPDDELPSNTHRTAGAIFNFELKPGNPLPDPKLYLPVRHYAKSDLDIARGLQSFFRLQGWDEMADSYVEDLKNIFPTHDLANTAGSHTYLSYSYKKKTGAAVTMYYNPRIYECPPVVDEVF